jgi:hypothetical protein
MKSESLNRKYFEKRRWILFFCETDEYFDEQKEISRFSNKPSRSRNSLWKVSYSISKITKGSQNGFVQCHVFFWVTMPRYFVITAPAGKKFHMLFVRKQKKAQLGRPWLIRFVLCTDRVLFNCPIFWSILFHLAFSCCRNLGIGLSAFYLWGGCC